MFRHLGSSPCHVFCPFLPVACRDRNEAGRGAVLAMHNVEWLVKLTHRWMPLFACRLDSLASQKMSVLPLVEQLQQLDHYLEHPPYQQNPFTLISFSTFLKYHLESYT